MNRCPEDYSILIIDNSKYYGLLHGDILIIVSRPSGVRNLIKCRICNKNIEYDSGGVVVENVFSNLDKEVMERKVLEWLLFLGVKLYIGL